jgi:lysozyme family protein
MSRYTQALAQEYRRLFDSLEIRPERLREVDRSVDQALALRPRYAAIGDPLGIPWHFIAAVHMRESSYRVDRHLHNGDPLGARTVRVPAGRPVNGVPPFSFEDSASDALQMKGLHRLRDWSLPRLLYQLEAYNGFGYRRRALPSPYLWSYSHHYQRGKFVRDGVYDPATVDQQCGTASLLRRLAERGEVAFEDEPGPEDPVPVVAYAHTRPRSVEARARAEALQHWLNTFPGIYLRVDGWPGQRTSDALRAVTGSYLPGDPRAT